jgi:hypothetical protein
MTTLVWDQVGERVYQTGVDRGVLYLSDNSGVAWNGLISVTEIFNREVKVFHLDGVKYLEHHVPGDFAADLKAYTYPDEFDKINGIILDESLGLDFHDQPPSSFGLSYRTLIGDDVSGLEYGYKIHILYNLIASPSNIGYTSLNNQTTPIEFGWTLSGTPVVVSGYRPTVHVSIDSTKIHPFALGQIEEVLYGSNDLNPSLPSLEDLIVLLAGPDFIIIIDNEDGTWTAMGPDELITMITATEFEITEANAEYINPYTYNISTTES